LSHFTSSKSDLPWLKPEGGFEPWRKSDLVVKRPRLTSSSPSPATFNSVTSGKPFN
jgi:hypothetical protein